MKRLVAYSSSDEDDSQSEQAQGSRKKLRRLPPLSQSLLPVVPVDDPALHQGRARTTPHVEGQWAAHVYVPVFIERRDPLGVVLKDATACAKELVPGLLPVGEGMDKAMELHISLTRPTYLRAHQREDLKRAIKSASQTCSAFIGSFSNFTSFVNDEGTRAFLAIEIGAGHDQFKALAEALTPTLRFIRQQEFYSSPRFHASFAWALLDTPTTSESAPQLSSASPSPTPSDTTTTTSSFPKIKDFPSALVPTLNTRFGDRLVDRTTGIFEADEIKVRIGKDVFGWKLRAARPPGSITT